MNNYPALEQLLLELAQKKLTQNYLFITPNVTEKERLYERLHQSSFIDGVVKNIWDIPGLTSSPYIPIKQTHKDLFWRFHYLDELVTKEANPHFYFVAVMDASTYQLKLPPLDFFSKNSLDIKVGDCVDAIELSQKLENLGYEKNVLAENMGQYAQRGSIFDIYPISGKPVRLVYYDEMIELIHPIDIHTQKSLREIPLESVHIGPSPYIFFLPEFRQAFSDYGPRPFSKAQLEYRKKFLLDLKEKNPPWNFSLWINSFFAPDTLTNWASYFQLHANTAVYYLKNPSSGLWFGELEKQYNEYLVIQQTKGDTQLYVPKVTYFFHEQESRIFAHDQVLELNAIPYQGVDLEGVIPDLLRKRESKVEYVKCIFSWIQLQFAKVGKVVVTISHLHLKKSALYLLEQYKLTEILGERLVFVHFPLEKSFYIGVDHLLYLAFSEISHSNKVEKVKKQNTARSDIFAEQLASLKVNDFVIHQTYGIGRYLGLESLNASSRNDDYLVIEYDKGDKVYVPAYKLHLVQKHAGSDAPLKVHSLQSTKFTQQKEKAKESAKKLAFDLIKLNAKRAIAQGFSFSAPNDVYREFEMGFPYEETIDQLRAIEDVISDLEKPQPMDRLVCGDVGFGKTEVAMRACMLAKINHKQCLVLVPTTLLALQHYQSFCKRFHGFNVNIQMLSRLRSTKDEHSIKADAKEGIVDILIGTHKILSNDLEFHDLGLFIIDEEQRFGVNQKEKIKSLYPNVDTMSLTATPIPRTMHMAMIGLRELSLIQSPPPRRMAIKTYIGEINDMLITQAIDCELSRDGQVFIVYNKIEDIEEVAFHIKKLVPRAKVLVGHGQLKESEFEKTMISFFTNEYNVLVCTTIIETGIDIPNANTLIILNAQNFGLSQLHQLRGRIGRSDKQAFAYFLVPQLDQISEVAHKRLMALNKYVEMGSGIQLATSDLEIRGAGELMGAEQSGHMDSIGLEMYMELLQECIYELQNNRPKVEIHDLEIHLGSSAFIPETYIPQSALRLRYYKKLSNAQNEEEINQLYDQMKDIYGDIPQELEVLFLTIRVRLRIKHTGIKFFKIQKNCVYLKFDQNLLNDNKELQEKVVNFFMASRRRYKLQPDFSVIFTPPENYKEKQTLGIVDLFSKELQEKLVV